MGWRDTIVQQEVPSSWRETIVKPLAKAPSEVSGLESLGRGAAQGATFNYGDEISPFVEKGIAILTGNPAYQNKSVGDLRETYRQQNKDAETANPGTYLGGELLGSLSTTAPIPLGTSGKVFGAGLKAGAKNLALAAAKATPIMGLMGALSNSGAVEENKGQAAIAGLEHGAKFGALATLAGKPGLELASAGVSKLFQGAQFLSNKVLGYFRTNPELVKPVLAAAQDKNAAIEELSTQLASQMTEKIKTQVTSQNQIIDSAIERYGDKPIEGQAIVNILNAQIRNIDRGGITPAAKSAMGQLAQMRNDFVDKYGLKIKVDELEPGAKYLSEYRGMGVQEPISGEQLLKENPSNLIPVDRVKTVLKNLGTYLNADSVNVLRKEFNAQAEPAYAASIGDNPILAKASVNVADGFRELLDVVSPDIRAANLELSKSIGIRQDVASKFGAKSLTNSKIEVDPADIQKIITRFHFEGKASSKVPVQKLSEMTGINLEGSADFIQAIKAVETEMKLLNRRPTGISNLLPIAGSVLGGASGLYGGHGDPKMGVAGSALGLLGAVLMQSPAGMQLLLKGPQIEKAMEGLSHQVMKSSAARPLEKGK